MFSPSSTRSSVFRDEPVLTPGYTPDEPLRRDDLLEWLADVVRPVVHRRTPENVYLYGPAGVGKTTLVTHVLRKLETETRVTTVYTNCWQYNTRPALLADLLIQLGYPAPRKGKPVDELLATLREWLTKHFGAVVALDEVDQLADVTEVVYDLRQMSIEAGTGLGLILVSDREPTALDLDPRSRSRLISHVVSVPPYSADDLHALLKKRVEKAFQPDAVTDEALRVIAETTAEHGGDCRRALNLLLQAGRRAERADARAVTKSHLKHTPSQNRAD